MIRATAATIPTVASAIRSVTASPAKAHPRSTATIGLTYAYVETRAGVVVWRRYTYAENPISDPKTIRYPSDRRERVDTAARSSREPSPSARPTTHRRD